MNRPFRQLHEVRPGQALSRFAFVLCVLLGIGGSIALKMVGIHPFIVALYAAVVLLAYAALAWVGGSVRLEPENIGDNCYYMGFLFTLASLAFTLYQIADPAINDGRAVDIPEVISGFGVALSSTIVGVFLRVLLMQMRPDFVAKEREVRADMNRSFTHFRRTLSQMLRQMKSYSTESVQMAAERDERMRKASEALVDDHHARLLVASEEFTNSLKNVIATTVEETLTRVEASIENTAQRNIEAVETASRKGVEALDLASSRNVEAIAVASAKGTEALGLAATNSMAAISAASTKSSEAIDLVSTRSAEAISAAGTKSVEAIELASISSSSAIDMSGRRSSEAIEAASRKTLAAIEASATKSLTAIDGVAHDLTRLKDDLVAHEARSVEQMVKDRQRLRDLLEKEESLLTSFAQEIEQSVGAVRRLSDTLDKSVVESLESKLVPAIEGRTLPAIDALVGRLEKLGHDAPASQTTHPASHPQTLGPAPAIAGSATSSEAAGDSGRTEPGAASRPANPAPSDESAVSPQDASHSRRWLPWRAK